MGPHLGGKMLKHKIRKSRKNILSLLEAVTQEEAEKGEQGKAAKEETGNSRKDKTGTAICQLSTSTFYSEA